VPAVTLAWHQARPGSAAGFAAIDRPEVFASLYIVLTHGDIAFNQFRVGGEEGNLDLHI
jgi:hypothetical protein